MKSLVAGLKKLYLRQIAMVFLTGLLLLVSTACSNTYAQGARPNFPPVQAGGANNPHKGMGDGFDNSKMNTPAKANRADLQLVSDRLVAQTTYDTLQANPDKIIYPGREPQEAAKFNPSGVVLREPGSITEESKAQPNFDRSDPNAQLLERVGAAFKDASGFLQKDADDNPALYSDTERGQVGRKSQ